MDGFLLSSCDLCIELCLLDNKVHCFRLPTLYMCASYSQSTIHMHVLDVVWKTKAGACMPFATTLDHKLSVTILACLLKLSQSIVLWGCANLLNENQSVKNYNLAGFMGVLHVGLFLGREQDQLLWSFLVQGLPLPFACSHSLC